MAYYPFTVTLNTTDLTNVQNVVINLGIRNTQDPLRAGTMTVSGRNISSLPAIEIGDPIFCEYTSPVYGVFELFWGTVADVQYEYYFDADGDQWTILCEDALATLGRTLNTFSWSAGDVTGTAVSAAMTGTGITATIQDTSSTVSAQSFTNANVLEVVNQLKMTEQAQVYVYDQEIKFRGRDYAYSGEEFNIFFTDGTVGPGVKLYRYDKLRFSSLADNYATRVVVAPQGLAEQTAGSGFRSFNATTYDQTTTQADNLAEYILETLIVDAPVPRELSTWNAQWDDDEPLRAASMQFDSRLETEFRSVNYASRIIGATISSTPDVQRCTFYLEDSYVAPWFRVGYGVLDYNKLGF